ncbi:uncharacterized protein PRCAT00004708001 [Priceomyces carsonii]|uniref:uncharacterized protein n=1 Tax=Priceomyces carsonii TaxID=28549 RepID=UPI002ED95379|nr:unnamed protein product [Priceomyces carsonii]
MSLLQANMLNNHQFNSFGRGHIRSRSCNEILSQLKNKINTPIGSGEKSSGHGSKRTFGDMLRESSTSIQSDESDQKRSKTAPPSQPCASSTSRNHENLTYRARSLSPNKKFLEPSVRYKLKVGSLTGSVTPSTKDKSNVREKLPSLADALQENSLSGTNRSIKLKPITPTVSLDYFDTYKPNDENWRYELLDTINKSSKHFNLNQYNYLNRHSSAAVENNLAYKPNFDSRISSKITKPTLIPKVNHFEKKINFPFESNYTYLNKTYMRDVERYPEYLELAHSLIQLSKPHQIPYHSSHTMLSDTPAHASIALGQNQQLNSHRHSHHHLETTIQSAQYSATPPRTHGEMISPPISSTNSYLHFHSLPSPPTRHALSVNAYQPYTVTDNSNIPTPGRTHMVSSPPLPTPQTKFVPITPPSLKQKARTEPLRSPTKGSLTIRVCLSCGSDQSPCWRPSWSIKDGQLCNSCGLRYKKTSARCLNEECKKIPAKGEWSLMQSKGKSHFDDGLDGYTCLDCGSRVDVSK